MHKFKVSLIITTYNWPEALFLVLKSVKNQFRMPDEIIVADDGSNKETTSLIKKFSKEFKFGDNRERNIVRTALTALSILRRKFLVNHKK